MKLSLELPEQPSQRRPREESDSFIYWEKPTKAAGGGPPAPALHFPLL